MTIQALSNMPLEYFIFLIALCMKDLPFAGHVLTP
jgi:hypothetical protein